MTQQTRQWRSGHGEIAWLSALVEGAQLAEPALWAELEPDEINPLTVDARTSLWPLDPLGPFPGDRGVGRRPAVESRAALVRAAADGPSLLPLGLTGRAEQENSHEAAPMKVREARGAETASLRAAGSQGDARRVSIAARSLPMPLPRARRRSCCRR